MNLTGSLKRIIKIIKYGYRGDSKSYVKHLKKLGCSIGERVTFFSPETITVDITRPWLVSIGNDVQITQGVKILTHGYDWSVLKGVYGDILGSSGAVFIGNNVFIGTNTIILKGVHIGNNVIIGAGSVVTGDIPDNCVAAGNPCKMIMSLNDYYERRKKAQVAEASELVKLYRNRYGKEPDDRVLHEFFWLFSDGDSILTPKWKEMMKLVGNETYSYKQLENNVKQFNDMSDFLDSIKDLNN